MGVVHRLYFACRPLIPHRVRIVARRLRAKRILARNQDVWPIDPCSQEPPAAWRGWPEGKKFAFVLTHDVERSAGLSRVYEVMKMEESLGFRSSFNFVPEGDYSTPVGLRQSLERRGFEVGVHDLKHDGKLYYSRNRFRRNASRINSYLKTWNAVGFRSGFMHHNLEWLHDLDVFYDSSTFDSDVFEPQPDGVRTIFPFWCTGTPGRSGYAELPCTLPQDSTLFLILQERTIAIWKQKLDWVAEHGGMGLLNVHPDYMCFSGAPKPGTEFPAELYRQFLSYVKERYTGLYWQALPRQVAAFCRQQLCPREGPETDPQPGFLSGKAIITVVALSNIMDPLLTAACDCL